MYGLTAGHFNIVISCTLDTYSLNLAVPIFIMYTHIHP